MTPFFWSQVVAACAFSCGLASYQLRQRRMVLLCLTCLATLNAVHFLLLDRHTPAVMMVLTASRYVTAIYSKRRRYLYLFLVVAVIGAAVTFDGPLSWLSMAAVLCGTVGSFHASDRSMRLCFMCGNSCWLVHNLLAITPVATVMEASFLISNVLGYWKFYLRRPQTPNS
ncbi:MAG: YgjV family protein [Planctomycetes bacterium]|nr:YgjV family protein [Planctomycetota bacterium]